MGGGGKGGSADVEYTQSPEQRMVYQALQPMIQRLGAQYGGYQPGQYTLPLSNITGGISASALPYDIKKKYRGSFEGIGALTSLPISKMQISDIQQYAPSVYNAFYPSTTTAGGTATGQAYSPLYNIPHPAEAVSTISPLVSPALWNPYQEAESQLMDVLQSRGQLGAPGAGISGAAAAGLGKFYEQAARNIGLQSYQMAMPLWEAQLQREMMPWQMLPGLLGGTYSTGIAQQGTSPLSTLSSGLMGAGTAYAMGAGWPAALMLGAGGMMGGK